MYDVVVIGGGPVGSYTAYRLAGMGYEVVVLEQHKQLGEQVCCTGIISRECATTFAVDSSVVLRPVNSAHLFSPSGRLIRLRSEEPQASVIDRTTFNRVMASRAQDKGAEYRLDSLATDLEVRDSGVAVKAVCCGERVNLETRVAVIATGFGSKFTDRLGWGKVGDFAIGAQAEVETAGVDEVEVYFGKEIAPGFFAWLVPTSPPRALVGLLARYKPELYLKRLLSSLLNQEKIVSAEVEPIYSGIPLKSLPRTYGERLIAVGNAAGQVKSTTGGGIYFGLLSAEIAANTLHRGLATDKLSAQGLADYEQGWRKKLGRELEIDYYARRFYQRLSDQQIDRIFDIIKLNGIDEALLNAEDLSFDWHSKAVLRLAGHQVLSKALDIMKIPFRPGGKDSY
ncbi:hypothetical protein ES703_27602 [subsurface metagenome]